MGKLGIIFVSVIAAIWLLIAALTSLFAISAIHQILASLYWIAGFGFIGLAFLLHSLAKLRESLVEIAWRSGMTLPARTSPQPDPAARAENWECHRCGRINAAAVIACACGAPRPSLSKK